MSYEQQGHDLNLRRSRPAYRPLPDSGILVFESHHSASFTMDFRRFDFHKICWIPVGRGALEFGSSRLPLAKDELLLTPAGDEHRFVDNSTSPMTLVIACFSDQVVEENRALQLLLPEVQTRFATPYPIMQMHSYRRGAVRDLFKRMLLEQSRGGARPRPSCMRDSSTYWSIFFAASQFRKRPASRASRHSMARSTILRTIFTRRFASEIWPKCAGSPAAAIPICSNSVREEPSYNT